MFCFLLPKKILCKKMSTSHLPSHPERVPNAKDGCIHLLNDELEKLQSITPLGAVSINGIAALPGDPWMKGRCVWDWKLEKLRNNHKTPPALDDA